ncbi:MAG: hypothetical protein ACJATI_001233 [Halioglobus sp.]|jgi:hypothetical protein
MLLAISKIQTLENSLRKYDHKESQEAYTLDVHISKT